MKQLVTSLPRVDPPRSSTDAVTSAASMIVAIPEYSNVSLPQSVTSEVISATHMG